eukprot:CAMPEP_0185905212 /NCGR_PEP_ID=MMETSP0196C-20130402/4450_1 /TAXON_ID=2932 /ORGANISM="Alexandrium fundyense, Strain CCMP1719" /LENGTH=94 /DNA_ID=CAMNT_0028624687 /DNA_START=23 /DNA_END=305 /DNA_ORIENTATION=-
MRIRQPSCTPKSESFASGSSRSAPLRVRREPRIDENTHKAMLAHYYKKQEEQKKLQDDDDDSYLDAQWADPKSLKSTLLAVAAQSWHVPEDDES